MAENYFANSTKFMPFDALRTNSLNSEKLIDFDKKENKIENKIETSYHKSIPQSTIPIPFSFEERNKQLLQKKEKYLQEIKNKKVSNQFHARPVPITVLQSPKLKPRQNISAHNSFENLKSNKNDEECSKFKARPATVLYTKPFKPKKESPKPIKVEEFTLSSEKRAKDREKFEQFLKEKEANLEEQKRLYEEKKILEDKKEIAKIRKESVRHAEPIRHYKEVKPVPPKPVTKPRSPPLTCIRKKLSF